MFALFVTAFPAVQGARAADTRVEISDRCKGSKFFATIESVIGPDGLPIAMERIPVSEMARPGVMVWELWSHRDGETWSERPLLAGTSRKGVRFVLQGFLGRLERVDLDKTWPDSEEILDFMDCWPAENT